MPIGLGDRVGHLFSPWSKRHLQRFTDPNGPEGLFLAPLAFDSFLFRLDHFLGDTIETDFWTTNAGTGATAFAVPATPLAGGGVRAASGTNATLSNRVVNMYGPPIFLGDRNCGIQVKFKVSAVTDIDFEIGFIDTYDTITTAVAACSDPDTPAFATSLGDAALLALYTGETKNTLLSVTLGSGSLNAGDATAHTGLTLPTADTYMRVRVQLAGNTVSVYTNDTLRTQKTSAIEGGTLVRPFFFLQGVSATSRDFDLDYVAIWQDDDARTA